MTDNTILDDPRPDLAPLRRKKLQRIFTLIEVGLWVLCGLAYPLSASLYIMCFSILMLFYLLCPIPLFGSVGWKRHIGSHLIGLNLAVSVASLLFVLAHWNGRQEQVQNTFKINLVATALTLLFYFLRKNSPRGNGFFLPVLLHIGAALVLMVLLMLQFP